MVLLSGKEVTEPQAFLGKALSVDVEVRAVGCITQEVRNPRVARTWEAGDV